MEDRDEGRGERMDDRGTRGRRGAHVGRAGGPPVEERQLGVVRVDVRERARVHVRREPDRLAEADVRPRPEHAGVAAVAPHRTHAHAYRATWRVGCRAKRFAMCRATRFARCRATCASAWWAPWRCDRPEVSGALPREPLRVAEVYLAHLRARPCKRCDTTRTAQRDPMRCAGVQDATCG